MPAVVPSNTLPHEGAMTMLAAGVARAEAIVAYRQENGRFGDIYDLANVKGIGDRTIELNEARIRLSD